VQENIYTLSKQSMVDFTLTSISGWQTWIFIIIVINFVLYFTMDGVLKFQKIEEAADNIKFQKMANPALLTNLKLLEFMKKDNKYKMYDTYRTELIKIAAKKEEAEKQVKTVAFLGANGANQVRWWTLTVAIVLIHLLLVLMAVNKPAKSSAPSSKSASKVAKRP